jgi:hypothetical protein
MAIVQEMIRELASRGIVAQWEDYSGGCYNVSIRFGEQYPYPQGAGFFSSLELLIGTQEGAFGWDDVNSDDGIMGFCATLYVYGPDEEEVTDRTGFNLYSSEYGLISAREESEQWADGVPASQVGKRADLQAEMLACVDAVAFYAYKVGLAQFHGRETDSVDAPKPEVVRVARRNGIAGQFAMTAHVQYGESTPQPVTFVGSVYGGPVAMIDFTGVQHLVYKSSRYGDFATEPEEWVYRYFDCPKGVPGQRG